MKTIIKSPHDRFTRAALSEQRVTKAFFEAHLPKNILNQIDLNSLLLTKESFVNPALKQFITDLLFRVQWQQQLGYLYLLVEAQSQAERFMPLRALKYQIEALEHHVKITKDKNLPIIYCLVLYNGKQPYNQPTGLFELFGEHEALARDTFLQPFQLIDLNKISDEEIRQNQWLAILEGCLKHSRDQDILLFFRKFISILQQAEQAGGQKIVEAALTYLLATGNIRNPQILETIIQQALSKEIQESMMGTMAEYYMKKARKEGLQRGMQVGMQQGIQEGLRKGKQEGEYLFLLRLLEQKFKHLSTDYHYRLKNANAETLLMWGERLLTANNPEEIFD